MTSVFRCLVVLTWLGVPVAGAIGFAALVRVFDVPSHPSALATWAQTSASLEVAFASLCVLAGAGCLLLTALNTAYMGSAALQHLSTRRAIDRVLPPLLRGLNLRISVIALSGAVGVSGTASASAEAPPVIRNVGNPVPPTTIEPAPVVLPAADDAPARAVDREYLVQRGDNFWTIAETVLVERGRQVDDRELAAYWRSLVTANADRLIDPVNPDMIVSGQILLLPD